MRYCLSRSYSTGVRAATVGAVLLMIPGMLVKTSCQKGFAMDDQLVLPTDESVRWAQKLAF